MLSFIDSLPLWAVILTLILILIAAAIILPFIADRCEQRRNARLDREEQERCRLAEEARRLEERTPAPLPEPPAPKPMSSGSSTLSGSGASQCAPCQSPRTIEPFGRGK